MANFLDNNQEKTVITYDKGAYWWSLNVDGKADVQLHLGMEKMNTLYRLPQVHATTSATGVVLANGWTGDTIPRGSQATLSAKTYLSEDGGRTWTKVLDEPHDFRILDHGGVLVFVPWNTKGNTLKFSLDEGNSISEFHFQGGETGGAAGLNFVGDFFDSQIGFLGWAGRDVNCEQIFAPGPGSTDEKPIASTTEAKFTCVKGAADWSPGVVTVQVKGGKTVMHGEDGCVYGAQWDKKTFKLSFDSKTTEATPMCPIKDTADNVGKAWVWTKDVDATIADTQVQIQGVATEPGGKSLVLMAYW
jgi:hypothetical protein